MSHKYLRCPVCGKLSKMANFQINNIGGRHRFPDVMVQEIFSEGRGEIRNEWYSEKLDLETKRELNKVFSTILSQVLDDISIDIAEIVEVETEDDEIKVETEKEIEKEEKKKKKWKDKEIFEVEGEDEDILEAEEEEISEVSGDDDEILEADEEISEVRGDDEVFQGGDIGEEEIFRAF